MTLATKSQTISELPDGLDVRKSIVDFENQISEVEGSFKGDNDQCPLKHSFSDGIYVREIKIPAGMYIVGKIHKHEHPNFLLSGTVEVVTEAGRETLVGPLSIMSPAGTKRALYAVTDLVWITVHSNPTNTQDPVELEKEVIADSYDDYEKFLLTNNKRGVLSMLKKLFRI